MSVSNCLAEARNTLSLFTNDELKAYTRDVMERARSYDSMKGVAAIDRAMKEIGDEYMEQMTSGLQTKINSQAKFDRNAETIKSGKLKLLNLVARRLTGLSNNVESAQRASRKLLGNAFFGLLEKDEFEYVRNQDNSLTICRAMDGKENVPEIAKRIGKKLLDHYIPYRNAEMVGSDALPLRNLNKDRFLRAIHDRNLLVSGGQSMVQAALSRTKYTAEQAKGIWREFIKPKLNMLKTFAETDAMDVDGKLNIKKVDAILDEIYDNIVADNPEVFPGGMGGSQRMFFYWKDMESMYGYAEQYGRKGLFENVMADVNASGNKIGMAQIFGDSPMNMYNDLAELQQKVNPVGKTESYNTMLTFKHLAGIDQSPVNATMANFFSSIRTLSSMKSLGKIAFLSLPDISNGISFSKRWGFDYWEAYTTYMGNMFNALPSEERQYVAEVFKEMTDTHMGYVGRFVDANNVPQVLNTASSYFFRGVGIEALDKGNKVSGLYLLSKNLGRMSDLSYEQLPEATQKQFGKFGFMPKEWDALRTKNNKGLFTVDNVEALTNDEIRAIYGATPDQPLYLLKNELYRKVYSMFDVWAENSVLTPGAFMRATTTMGTRSGTLAGELLRTVMQFKAYALSFLDRVLYQGFSDADSAQAKIGFMVQLMGATLPMSFLSYWLNNLASGRSMPSWNAMNAQEKINYAADMMFPSAGILVNFFDPERQNQDLIANLLNTPSMKVLSNGISAPLALAGGDVKKFAKSMEKLGKGITPGLSLPFIDPYLRQAMGDKAYLKPGQVQLYGA